MGVSLDIDDVTADHLDALAELRKLRGLVEEYRAELKRLRDVVSEVDAECIDLVLELEDEL